MFLFLFVKRNDIYLLMSMSAKYRPFDMPVLLL